MITVKDLAEVPLFLGLERSECLRLAQKAADIRVEGGEWVIREGEDPRFFVVLEGSLQAVKDIVGQRREIDQASAGDFFGEVPIFMGTSNLVSVYAVSRCRLARFDRQQLQELIRDPSCGAKIFQRMAERLSFVPQYVRDTPSSRVVLAGSPYDSTYHDICKFLSVNRVQYDCVEGEPVRGSASRSIPSERAESTAIVDGVNHLLNPTVRQIADALGFKTAPQEEQYDLVIIGAGPAGMAAAVYSASEGLKVLVIERSAAGGQAGTSSRIENYLGFPAGISGDELTERALKQARHFGAEIVVTRSITSVSARDGGYCLQLDGEELIGARAVLLCTGVDWHQIEILGLDRLLGRGVLYGASRHEAHDVAGRTVFVIGAGNSAGQAAVFFSNYAAEVVMLVRGPDLASKMSRYLIEQIEEKANIRVDVLTEATEVRGEEHLGQIVTATRAPGGIAISLTRAADALFLMIGATANTAWLPQSMERDPKGFIRTGRDLTKWSLDRVPFPLETSLPGIFCAGDVRFGSIKRVAGAVGEGSMSIAFIHEYLALTEGI